MHWVFVHKCLQRYISLCTQVLQRYMGLGTQVRTEVYGAVSVYQTSYIWVCAHNGLQRHISLCTQVLQRYMGLGTQVLTEVYKFVHTSIAEVYGFGDTSAYRGILVCEHMYCCRGIYGFEHTSAYRSICIGFRCLVTSAYRGIWP